VRSGRLLPTLLRLCLAFDPSPHEAKTASWAPRSLAPLRVCERPAGIETRAPEGGRHDRNHPQFSCARVCPAFGSRPETPLALLPASGSTALPPHRLPRRPLRRSRNPSPFAPDLNLERTARLPAADSLTTESLDHFSLSTLLNRRPASWQEIRVDRPPRFAAHSSHPQGQLSRRSRSLSPIFGLYSSSILGPARQ
jgi:hypothetical protein